MNEAISRNQVSSGNMTIWKGMTIAATKVMKMLAESLVLVRTRTHAACEERTLSRTREDTVMITELRKEEEYCTFGLVQMVAMFTSIFIQSVGRLSGLCVISKGVLAEFTTTMKKGKRNTRKSTSARISGPRRSLVRRFFTARLPFSC